MKKNTHEITNADHRHDDDDYDEYEKNTFAVCRFVSSTLRTPSSLSSLTLLSSSPSSHRPQAAEKSSSFAIHPFVLSGMLRRVTSDVHLSNRMLLASASVVFSSHRQHHHRHNHHATSTPSTPSTTERHHHPATLFSYSDTLAGRIIKHDIQHYVVYKIYYVVRKTTAIYVQYITRFTCYTHFRIIICCYVLV